MKGFERILVISNNCLSYSSANGRTIKNFINLFEPDKVANFYLSGYLEKIEKTIFFRMTDKDAIKKVFTLGLAGGGLAISFTQHDNVLKKQTKRKYKKPVFYILRDFVWRLALINHRKLYRWVNSFKPTAIVIFSADSSFLNDLSIKLSKKYKIPLISYSTENYCLKNNDYISKTLERSLPFKILQRRIFNSTKKLYNFARLVLFSTKDLSECFLRAFPNIKNDYIYQCSYLTSFQTQRRDKISNVIYAGNLSLGRAESLLTIADIIESTNADCIINVYSSTLPDEYCEKYKHHKCICFKGFVGYDELLTNMKKADLLIHCESFDYYSLVDLEYAFSTKIGDSLMSGIPFFLYAPKSLSETKYMSIVNPQFVASSFEELKLKLTKILNDKMVYQPDYYTIYKDFSPQSAKLKLSKIIKESGLLKD